MVFWKGKDALTYDEKQGFSLFMGKGKCASCHLVDQDYALFTDNRMHNTGHGFATSMGIGPDKTRIQLAPECLLMWIMRSSILLDSNLSRMM